MSLQQTVHNDLITAMKAKDATATSILRMLIAALKNKTIEKREELTDEEVLAVIQSEIKNGPMRPRSMQRAGVRTSPIKKPRKRQPSRRTSPRNSRTTN